MKSKLFLAFALLAVLMLYPVGCSSDPNCPTCGTTEGGTYRIIDIMPVPEHNPTGEPGGPFNSFDISWVDTPTHRFYVSDRIGLDVPVFDTLQNVSLYSIGGDNVVSSGTIPAPCDPSIPPLQTAVDPVTHNPVFTRFGCRTDGFGFFVPGFGGPLGANGDFGGWAGAQCCASRSNGVNPISCPCGEAVTADGKTLFVGNSSSSVVVFDLTNPNADIAAGKTGINISPPTVIAVIPTGTSPDFDGPNGVAPCIVAWTGRAGADPTCGDDRADELSLGTVGGKTILAIDNGDPSNPFVTFIDVTEVVNRTGHCLPRNPGAAFSPTNPSTCIIGQIYYDGGTTNVYGFDAATGLPCPDPSSAFSDGSPVPSGIPGVPCVHAPIAPAGLGGSTFNPNTGHFLTANPNDQGDPHVGAIDDVDPLAFLSHAPPIVTHEYHNCMPGGTVQGPGNQFLVGCIDHDGMAFPPQVFVIDGTSGDILANFDQVGGVDETWFNPGDGNYYLAARDMPNGPKLGIINATTNTWLENVPTNSNSHSVSVDSSNNHIFVPLQSGGPCGTQSSAGCVGIYARE